MGFPRRPRATPTQKKRGSSSSGDSTTTTPSQSSSSTSQLAKRQKLGHEPLFDKQHTKVFIVVAKLEAEEIRELTRLVEENGGKCVSRAEDATIIVSQTKVWKRLKKYLPEHGFGLKRIVTLDWLYDSVRDGLQKPFDSPYLITIPTAVDRLHLEDDGEDGTSSARSMSPSAPPPPPPERLPTDSNSLLPVVEEDPVVIEASPTTALDAAAVRPTKETATWADNRTAPPKWQNKRYACQRWHPLVCINQDLVLELRYIRDSFKMEGDERRQMTYSKAMAALKAYPHRIRSVKEAQSILAVGEKIAAQCGEYIKNGKIEAAEKVKHSDRQRILTEFAKIHGVGSSTARELYDKYECRSIADVEKVAHKLPSMGERSTHLVDEFDVKIPRTEVEEIARTVDIHLQAIIPSAEYTICGGYRRGKMESNDVDIIFTHREDGREKGVLEKLLARLQEHKLVTDILYIALTDSKRDSSMQHFHASHMDPLDKAFTVFKGPSSPVHRRVDLIAAPYKYYPCAVLGWSGSTIFERDLRLYADKVKGMKFDSGGLWYRANSKEIVCKSEREIFEVLGLEYIPPEWRNADV